jgi:hypothetical protein
MIKESSTIFHLLFSLKIKFWTAKPYCKADHTRETSKNTYLRNFKTQKN